MKLGKRQQARRITPPPVQEAMPPPRQPMVSYPTGPWDMPPPGYGPDGPPYGYAPDGSPLGHGPDGSPLGYAPDGSPPGHGPEGMPWMGPGPGPYPPDAPWSGDGQEGFAPMAYAFAPDGTPVLQGTDGPPPGFVMDGPQPPYMPDGPPMGYPEPRPYTAPEPPQAAFAPEPAYAPEPPQVAYAPEPQLWDPPAPEAPTPVEPQAVAPVEPEAAVRMPSSPTHVPDRQVTWEPEPGVPAGPDDAPPWPDFAPINRVAEDAGGNGSGVERLPSMTQAHRLRLDRPHEPASMVRTSEMRLARLHLRGGMLALARASLEQLAGVGTLDREALADLAETRWRSGDPEGAAEAAEAHLRAGGDEPIPRVIAAEWSARDGRILDARQLATQVQGQVGEGLERLFAGEPRSAVWPPAAPGWMDAGALSGGRFGLLVGGAEVAQPDADTWPTVPVIGGHDARATGAPTVSAHTSPHPAPFHRPADAEEAGREADRELQAAERDLARGDLVALSDRLGLLLRRDPALAPVILSIAEHALSADRDPAASAPGGPSITPPGVASLQMLRGDILRGQGHETDATQAYQQALRALPGRAITREST